LYIVRYLRIARKIIAILPLLINNFHFFFNFNSNAYFLWPELILSNWLLLASYNWSYMGVSVYEGDIKWVEQFLHLEQPVQWKKRNGRRHFEKHLANQIETYLMTCSLSLIYTIQLARMLLIP
jgi:hypothetical protein